MNDSCLIVSPGMCLTGCLVGFVKRDGLIGQLEFVGLLTGVLGVAEDYEV